MMDSFEYASLIYHSLYDLSHPLSLAFSSTLADPHSWAAPSPLDSPDPIGVFDSILYPTFEREIVSLLFLPSPQPSVVNKSLVLKLYLLRAQHTRPARAACPF